MAATKQRQFGFTFLLFIPLLAYWSYDTFVKWYTRKGIRQEQRELSEIAASADTSDEATQQQLQAADALLTAVSYSKAFSNILQGVIGPPDCLVIVSLLRRDDTKGLIDGLQLVLKLSVTTAENKIILLKNGVGEELCRLIRSHKDLPTSVSILVINAINNLSLSEGGQLQFASLVGPFLDVCMGEDNSLAVAALQSLTNLSVTTDCHESFTRVVQSLYNLLDSHSDRQIQVCKVLVNLSSNSTLVPYLLAAKRPECSFQLIEADDALRWLRFLVNISHIVLSEGITDMSLPTIYKAASPDTMYSFLYGVTNQSRLSNLLLYKRSRGDEELNQLHNELYKNINFRALSVPGS
ncbi:armadillo repeat-containing protein 10-like isoform X2 [Watersipora subatra]|uniref:armadillo repeat-containing protein 10-like isoform X2 n=1 Tax=Watersipora subatra TaxID=2589382 RepID=UPI00355B2454